MAAGKVFTMKKFAKWFADECEKRGIRWYHLVIYFAMVIGTSAAVTCFVKTLKCGS